MEEKRGSARYPISITTIVKKQLPDSNYMIMEFLSADLSHGGVFILAEDLAIFDLGDEIEVLVDIRGDKYYEGFAKVVRSARIFSDNQKNVRSGYGLMFLNPDEEFKNMLKKQLESNKET